MTVLRIGIVRLSVAAGCALLLHGCSPSPELAGMPDEIDYNWHVRPILSENCFKCHGPDPETREAGLRLDLAEAALAELPETPGKHAIVAGDPGESELIRRVTSENRDERMPPESEHKTLSALQVEILREWIDAGAEYKKHWAFIAPEKIELPEPEVDERAANDIDRFVQRRLEQEGLGLSPEADAETLINRVHLTLTGLPPSLEEVDAFMSDPSPDAYEQLVDRLLASPQYAEHMAAYWMDLARWSETDGFLDDHHDRFLWPWRDWVIAAFRDNMPYDEFGTLQLAGDLLPDATREQILATAFVRVGKRTTENGAIEAEYKAETLAERTDNALGTAFMGLTVGCARCHDHKYDPISHRDYYSLSAFFNHNNEPGVYAPGFSAVQGGPTLPWPDDETAERIAVAESAMAQRETAYLAARADETGTAAGAAATLLESGPEALAREIRESLEDGLTAYYPFDAAAPASLEDLPPPRPHREAPREIVELVQNAFGSSPPPAEPETEEQRRQREQAELLRRVPRNYNAEELALSPAQTVGVPAAVLQEPLMRKGVKGQAMFFNETNKGFLGRDVGWYERTEPFTIDFWFYAAEAYDDVPVINHRTEQNSGRSGYSIDIVGGRLSVTLAHSPPANMIAIKSVDAFPVAQWTHVTLSYDGSSRAAGTRLYLDGEPVETRVEHDSLTRSMLPWGYADVFDPFVGLAFGTRFRVKAPVGSGLDELRLFGRDLTPIEVAFLHDESRVLNGNRAAIARDLAALLVARAETVAEARSALTGARQAHNEIVSVVPQVLVLGEAPQFEPTYLLERGVYSSPGEEVQPKGLESVFEWDESLPQNRLGLARWLFDPQNPLTARVFVNRMWQMHFGRGIVETSEDFGAQGSIPTHPELLDWLTVDFVESGWDIKRLHRRIVLSSTYRQRSDLTDELLAQDPRNELLARGPRWRMTAEMVRDHALSASGLLVDEIGGPSVKPYQPDGIWSPLNSFYAYPAPESMPADEHHRRTLYSFVKRNALHPALTIFDFTNRTESRARRRSSNTPLQALILMNDPQYVEAYRQLATHVLKWDADDRARLTHLYRLAARTTPTDAHVDLLLGYYASQQETFAANDQKARDLLQTGVTEADPNVDAAELAAMTNVAALVMNSPDAYTVQ